MKQGVDQKGPKLSCGSAAGFRVSLCLIQHVIEAATVENRVSTQHPRCSLPAGKPCLFLPTNSIFGFFVFFFPLELFALLISQKPTHIREKQTLMRPCRHKVSLKYPWNASVKLCHAEGFKAFMGCSCSHFQIRWQTRLFFHFLNFSPLYFHVHAHVSIGLALVLF